MGTSFGRQVLSTQVGNGLMALYNLDDVEWKPAGITFDWSTVTAVSGADVTLNDKTVVAIGQKGIRYGQILCQITATSVQTVTLTSATGGTFTLTVVVDGVSATTSNIAYNASAASVRVVLEALSTIDVGDVLVTGSAGGPYTITFTGNLANLVIPAMTYTDSTTGAGHAIAVAIVTAGQTTTGYFGPYDVTATDGRQTLTRGQCYILNQTVLENGVLPGLPTAATMYPPGVFDGGLCWLGRLIIGSSAHELGPAGPTVSAFETAFPDIKYAQ